MYLYITLLEPKCPYVFFQRVVLLSVKPITTLQRSPHVYKCIWRVQLFYDYFEFRVETKVENVQVSGELRINKKIRLRCACRYIRCLPVRLTGFILSDFKNKLYVHILRNRGTNISCSTVVDVYQSFIQSPFIIIYIRLFVVNRSIRTKKETTF